MEQGSIFEIIGRTLDGVFGSALSRQVFGQATLRDVLAAVILFALVGLVALLARGWARWLARRKETSETEEGWLHQLIVALAKPAYLLIWIGGLRLALIPLLAHAEGASGAPQLLQRVTDKGLDVAIFATLIWSFYRLTYVLQRRLEVWARKSEGQIDDLLVPPLVQALRVILPIVAVILGLPLLGLPAAYSDILDKVTVLILICGVAWVLVQAVRLVETILLLKYDVKGKDVNARGVVTQVRILSRTAYFIITIFTLASMLMVFDQVRRFGANILASAGVVGIIMGFAAQRTIANLFAGFQIAMAQPIRLEDVVIVENEWGRVEEITLTYVVVRIWDQRRLVVPISYFIEKPFQNWTRVSGEIIGTVFVFADYTVPVDEIRKEVKRLVESHPNWDKRFWNVQITDATDRAIQIRVLVTASDSGKAWDMRCDIRERLIDFLQKNHAVNLPRTRAEIRDLNPPERASGRPPSEPPKPA